MNVEKVCKNCSSQFAIEPDDFGFYEKIQVPPPTFCPDCRKQRRLTWRNDTSLYSRQCDLCKKSIISIYAPNSGMTVYCQKCWWSDKWDPKSYGQDYDFNKSFFVQFIELQRRVPALTTVNDDGIASVNCEYTHDFAFGKNCYTVLIAWKVEECLYSVYVVDGKEIVDALNSMGDCAYTYETVYTEKCYQCRYVYYSVSLLDCAFCYDCRDCSDCFLCAGLRHKKYCFKNKQYTKEEYEKILSDYKLDTDSDVERAKREFQSIYYSSPRRFASLRNCVNCTGDSLTNGKNSKFCFNVRHPENCKWVENADTPKDSYDLSVGGELNQCYEGITPDHSYRGLFAIFSWENTNVTYVDGCHSSKDLFGCCGLKKAQYCVLNKQYDKESFEKLRIKIIQQMNGMPYTDKNGVEYKFGEFFPSELSYFKYNETVAQDYYPLSFEEVKKRNLTWQDRLQFTTGKETMKPEALPDSIHDVSDSITDEILACAECGRNYRIVSAELKFYRRMAIPIPRRCFYCRHRSRFVLRNLSKLWHCQCMCDYSVYKNSAKHSHHLEGRCPNEFETPYVSDRPEIVYCEQCYQAEVV